MERQICDNGKWKDRPIDPTSLLVISKLFKIQKELCEKIDKQKGTDLIPTIVEPLSSTEDRRVYWIKEMLACLSNEIEEIRGWLPWKTWKTYPEGVFEKNLNEIKFECVDLVHFVVELMMIVGITPEEAIQLYQEKLEQNHKRQDNVY